MSSVAHKQHRVTKRKRISEVRAQRAPIHGMDDYEQSANTTLLNCYFHCPNATTCNRHVHQEFWRTLPDTVALAHLLVVHELSK
jgi:hypothetical protein